MGRLGEREVEALGQEQEHVEEATGQRDVVVDHEQPVMAGGGVLAQERVEVLELPGAVDAWDDRHLMVGAGELPPASAE